MELDKNATILVADDDEFYRDIMRTMLNGLGFEHVREAANGREALLTGRECNPLFALLDIYMPEMNGWEVVEKFKEDLPDTILLMISGSSTPEDIDAAFSHGIDGYFLKPCQSDMLLDSMTKAVDLRDKRKRYQKRN
jgi:two-component system OmpR family response regulator